MNYFILNPRVFYATSSKANFKFYLRAVSNLYIYAKFLLIDYFFNLSSLN